MYLLYSILNVYNFLKWFQFCNNVQIVFKLRSVFRSVWSMFRNGGVTLKGLKQLSPALDLGVQHLQEEFVHGHASVPVQPAETVHGSERRLPQQRERHEQASRAVRFGRPLAALVVLQGLVEPVLEALHGLGALHVLCVWKKASAGSLEALGCWSAVLNSLKHLTRKTLNEKNTKREKH